jgi:hypothetical protein
MEEVKQMVSVKYWENCWFEELGMLFVAEYEAALWPLNQREHGKFGDFRFSLNPEVGC